MNTFKMMFKLLSFDEKKELVKVLMLVFIMAILESLGVISIMPFLAVASNSELGQSNQYLALAVEYAASMGISNPDDFLIVLGLISFVVIFFSSIFKVYTQYTLNNFIELRRHSISSNLYATYLSQRYDFFLNKNSSAMSKDILSEVDLVVQQVLRPTIQMIAYSFVVIILMVLLVMINPIISCIVAVIFVGLYVTVYLIAKNRLRVVGKARAISNEGRFLTVNEGFGGIKAIKLDKTEKIFINRFKPYSQSYSKSQAIAVTINQVPQYIVEALAIGGVILATIVAIVKLGGVNSSAFSALVPLIGVYVFSAYRLQPALRTVYQGLASIKYGYTALDSIMASFSNDNKSDIAEVPNFSETEDLTFSNNITLKNITYAYPESNTLALNDVSIDIPKNKITAVIGKSGSGKTTLIDIILGLLTPNSGDLFVDGKKLNAKNLSSYQDLLGYVPQDVYLSDSTISSNIAFGVPSDELDFEKVVMAAKLADIHDFCLQNEKGYNTLVGERGCNLSGGQRQRLGIARALYKSPKILVLDEATSALDQRTEQNILKSLTKLQGSLTIVFITHKISLIKSFDQVICLENGQLITPDDNIIPASSHVQNTSKDSK